MPRDPEQTRRALLDAGRVEFAQYGVAGARVDRIAAAAGVNKERIYGHFGSKEDLFAACFADAMADITAEVELPEDKDFAGYVARKLDYHGTHPQNSRLSMWEALELGAGHAAASEERRAIYDRKAAALAGMLGVDDTRGRYALVLSIALGTIEQVWPTALELVLGEDYDREEFRRFVAEAGARAVETDTGAP